MFKKKHPNLTVTMVIDYDKDHYVVEALKDSTKVDYSDPFYGVNKHTGQVSYFTPAFDLDAFTDALENKVIWINGIGKNEADQVMVHHGIEGQKWGVRRYQNPDGTLTDAGRKHYGYDPKQVSKDVKKIQKRGDSKKIQKRGDAIAKIASTNTVKQIYSNNKTELRDLRKKAQEASENYNKVYEDELSKRDDGKNHPDYYWEMVAYEAENTANRLAGKDLREAIKAYHDKCKELANEAFGDYFNASVGSLNEKDANTKKLIENYVGYAIEKIDNDMRSRNMVSDAINGKRISK